MLKLRVVFQGGGARLAILLAAADALQRICAQSDEIEIVHIAGVSAGSIAGAALASGEPIDDFRQRLIPIADVFVEDFEAKYAALKKIADPEVRTYADQLVADHKNGRMFNFLSLPTLHSLLKDRRDSIELILRVLNGGSFLPFNQVEDAIEKLFPNLGETSAETASEDLCHFSKLKIPLSIYSTNLQKFERFPYGRGRKPPIPLHSALARSCAMPGVFRGYNNNWEFDGGLTGNLPLLSSLQEDRDPEIRTLCFAFQRPTIELKNIADFGQALLTCAMQSSVQEAILQTIETGGAVCYLPDLVGTFDFGKALRSQLKKAEFRDLSSQILEGWTKQDEDNKAVEVPGLGSQIEDLHESSGYRLVQRSLFRGDEVAEIFDQLYRLNPVWKQSQTRVYVDRGSREVARVTGRRPRDLRFIVDKLMPTEGSAITLAEVGLAADQGKLDGFSLRVRDKHKQVVDCTSYIHRAKTGGDKLMARVLIFLSEAIKEDRCPLVVSIRYEAGPLLDFSERPWEAIVTRVTTPTGVGQIDWLWTKANGAANKTKPSYSVTDAQSMSEEQRTELARVIKRPVDFANWVSGVEIAPAEVDHLISEVYGDNLRPCELFGFRVKDLKHGSEAGALIAAT